MSMMPVTSPIFYKTGAHKEIFQAFKNITYKKLESKKLDVAAAIYRSLEEAVLAVDDNNRIIAVNSSMSSLIGLSEDQMLHKTIESILFNQKSEISYKALFEQADKTGSWQGEVKLQNHEKKYLTKWVAINNVYDSNGKLECKVVIFSKINEQKLAEHAMWYQANFDDLTKLPNRRKLNSHLEQELIGVKRGCLNLGILAIDLDGFKEVNDTLGHDIGDLLLLAVSSRLLNLVAPADTVSRFEGGEFVIILSNVNLLEDVQQTAKKIIEEIKKIFYINNESIFIGASIGVTFASNESNESKILIKNAKLAMISAKKQGKNKICHFTSDLQDASLLRMRLSKDMRDGLNNDQFKVVYQPIINLTNNEVYKAEALIRWNHPVLGAVSPAQFITVAEENCFILQLDDWILSEAIDLCSELRENFHPNFKISVNKSPVEFTNEVHLDSKQLIGMSKIENQGGLVIFEITEGLLLKDDLGVKDRLQNLRRLGTQIALDDFGTGYSSLSYLNKFDIDYIKIDQSFVRNLQDNSRDYALCEAIIVMAHKLGAQVVAEGIETQGHFDLLKKAGCDYGQGYYISKPLSVSEFQAWLNHKREC